MESSSASDPGTQYNMDLSSARDLGTDQILQEAEEFLEWVDDVVGEPSSDTLANGNLSNGRPPRGRKRTFPQNRAERKISCNRNQSYVTARGKEAVARKFDETFRCECKQLRCTSKVPVEIRQKLFDQFWSIGTFEGRSAFLWGAVSRQNVTDRDDLVDEVPRRRRRRLRESSPSQQGPPNRNTSRSFVYTYHLESQIVCKKTFLRTFQIGHSRVGTALNKQANSNSFQDLRGRKPSKNKFDDEIQNDVKTHINSFPKYISHYCREKTEARYLSPDLTLVKMCSLFNEDREQKVSLSYYKKIFYRDFNLRFKLPSKDTCRTCDIFKASASGADEERKIQLDAAHRAHLEKAHALRQAMKSDLEESQRNPEVETLTFDLQKTHPLPKIPTNIAYYKRQLNLYNLGIHVGSSGQGIFNVWLEHEGGRGTQEIGSCLLKYTKHAVESKHLRLWADSCGGQNRSIKMVMVLKHLLATHPTLETISLKFLLSGHSFLPTDSEFGDVEC